MTLINRRQLKSPPPRVKARPEPNKSFYLAAMYYLIKLLISAGLIVAISEIVKRTGFWGALLASLPLISLISIGWIYFETRDVGKICAFSTSVFWLVIPSLAFFIALPASLQRYSFGASMVLSIIATLILYIALILLLPRAGIKL